MIALFLAANDLDDFYRSMRERFTYGGSFGQLVLVFALLGLVIVLAYLLSKIERAGAVQAEPNHAEQLFRDVLPKLDLSTAQRHALDALAADLKLPHPAVLLLSEELFDLHVAQWRERVRGGSVDPSVDEALRRARSRLFPTGVGWVSSQPAPG